MTLNQRYKYLMFDRVSNFGTDNRELFPETSRGGQTFARVAAAVSTIEAQLTKRDLARLEAGRVRAGVREALRRRMQAIVQTARRATREEVSPSPFILPHKEASPALLSRARLFAEEAKRREAEFASLGLPSTFFTGFAAAIDALHAAVETQNHAQSRRAEAQTAVEHALAEAFQAVRDLDVLVPNALQDDPVRLGAWRGARQLKRQGRGEAETPSPTADAPVTAPPTLMEATTAPNVVSDTTTDPLRKVS